jgi:excisionase family DNA binding protein
MGHMNAKNTNQSAVQNLRSNPPLMLSAPEAAQFLGIHLNTLRKEIRAKRLKVVRIGKRQIIPLKNLEALADSAQ